MVKYITRYCKICRIPLTDELLVCSSCEASLGNEEDYTDPQMDLFGDD